MAYTTIDDPTIYFNTKLYTGNGSTQSITGVGFQPDWLWIKNRSGSNNHILQDAVRGATKSLESDGTAAETTSSTRVTSFDSDGFSIGSAGTNNTNSNNYVSWNWLAGGTAPAITYNVKVVSDSGNKYRFDDFGTSAVTLDLQEGGTYTFDQSDSSNSGHPLRFSTTSNGTHGGGSEYTTGVTTTGTPGSSGAKTVITVAASAPTLYYYCTQHSGMGGQANTNSLFGSSNFSGSIQSTASAGSTQGLSIVSFTGNSTAGATVGHGLGVVPSVVLVKSRDGTYGWGMYHHKNTSAPETDYLSINNTDATVDDVNFWNDTAPTSSVFSLGGTDAINKTSNGHVAYCFAEKKGYSKFGSYVGNGNANGTFVYTGFKPALIILKESSASGDNWRIIDNKRLGYNENNYPMYPSVSNAEGTEIACDMLSNGFKLRSTGGGTNQSGNTFIYICFAESPFVNSNGVPTNAR